jgi:phenylalanine-4-hydroxylase
VLYQKVRDVRDGSLSKDILPDVWADLKVNHPNDWLCPLEIYELLHTRGWHAGLKTEVKQRLDKLHSERKEFAKLIADGIELVHEEKQ